MQQPENHIPDHSPQHIGQDIAVLITSGSMFGIWGVFLGIPVYASAKVVISALFEWYKEVSGLYEKDEVEEIQSEE